MSEIQQNTAQSPEAAAQEFGRKLRESREQRGLSIGEVAERLKLPARQIEGLESGNYEGMPELIFVRGFLRTYSRFLDLDDNEVAGYLDRIMPNSQPAYAANKNTDSSGLNYRDSKIKKPFPTWILGVIGVAAIAVGVYAWQSKSNAENEKQAQSTEQHVGLGEVAEPNLNSNVAVVPMTEDASAVSPAIATQQPEANTASASGASVAATANELVVKVRYRSNLVIKDKNGEFVVNKIVPAGSEHRFSGNAPYDVWIGYALGATASYNGEEIAVNKHMISKKTSSFKVGQ